VKLPNPKNAIINSEKLTGYCLNPEHPDGQHKAIVFKSALDLDLDDVEELQIALLKAVVTYDAVPAQRNSYGQKYTIDFLLTRLGKQAIIHSVWIVRNSEDFPRLVTCYIL